MSTDEEQLRYLEDATKIVKEQAFYMKRAMDGDSLKLALDHATEMLRELRTNLLTPKNYYELYMKVIDELRELEEYFASLQRNGKSMVDLYEQVQCCGNIVPRLYLLCCVGSIYIQSKEEPAKDILKDLVEMTKGVQHPMRGLFLRNYLTLVAKNKLPDIGSPYEGDGGNVEDSCQFLIQNFIETNRLWVRLQTQGSNKDKKKREKERMDLRVLVGANLVRLSQLEGLDINLYKNMVLPKILEEIVACKDTIAQGYLMDCVIQVFPDEFHLSALEMFLKTCTELKEKVNVRTILETMMNRLAVHAANNGNGGLTNIDINAFKMFNDCVTTLIEDRTNMTLPEILKLQTVLTNFALKCYPTRFDYVTHTLGTCCALIEKMDTDQTSSTETTEQIELLLSAPLSTLALRVLEITPYSKLMTYLPWNNWRQVANNLMRSVVSSRKPLLDSEQVEQLFNAITPLLRDKDGANTDNNNKEMSTEFKEEQLLVARVVHLMKNDDTDALLVMYVSCRTYFTNGGSQRMQYTLVPLVFAALLLTRRVFAREAAIASGESDTPPRISTRKVFQFILEIVTALATSFPELAYNLFLQAVQAADACNFNQIAYQFATEALLIYESEIVDSKLQPRALTTAIGTLLCCKNFTTEDYETIITKVAQYSYKLLKKPDQCRMVILCSHLFWPKPHDVVAVQEVAEGEEAPVPTYYNHPERVLECMQKSLKIASGTDPNLFVEILDRYVYYFENHNPSIQVRFLSGLIAIINEQLGIGGSQATPAVGAHYRNTLEYIRKRQQSETIGEKFQQIQM